MNDIEKLQRRVQHLESLMGMDVDFEEEAWESATRCYPRGGACPNRDVATKVIADKWNYYTLCNECYKEERDGNTD